MLYKSIFLHSCHACVDCSAMTWNFTNYRLTAWLPKLTNFSLVCGFKIKYYLSIQEHVLCMGPLISCSHQSEWSLAANWPITTLKILNYDQLMTISFFIKIFCLILTWVPRYFNFCWLIFKSYKPIKFQEDLKYLLFKLESLVKSKASQYSKSFHCKIQKKIKLFETPISRVRWSAPLL